MSTEKQIKISEIRCNIEKYSLIGKIVSKSKINKFLSGTGHLFSIDLDDKSNQIRMIFFNEMADKHFGAIDFGKWYTVSSFRVVTARKGKNAYELQCTPDTKFVELQMDEDPIQYTSIQNMRGLNPYVAINVIGMCKSISNTISINKKDNSGTFAKKVVDIIDQNDESISVQFFDTNCESAASMNIGVIAAFKNLTLKEYNKNQYLVYNDTSSIELDPENETAVEIKDKFVGTNFEEVIGSTDFQLGTFEDAIKNFSDGKITKFKVHAKIIDIDSTRIYKECPIDKCHRKATVDINGNYECKRCNKSFAICNTHALLQILTENSSRQWLTSFHLTSMKLLGMNSDEFGYLSQYNQVMLQERFATVIGKYYEFDLTAKAFGSSNDMQFIIENINDIIAKPDKPVKEIPDGTRRKRAAAGTAPKQTSKMIRK